MIELTATSFEPERILREFTKRSGGAGAIVSFTGLVRSQAAAGDVTNLHLQAYTPLTENGIENAATEALQRWELLSLHITHRIGDMKPGDPIVFVATASRHRRAAFEAADFLMDYLKTKAVFWKKETSTEGERWIEPREEDYADAERWQQTEG